MNKTQSKVKAPMNDNKIFRVMLIMVFVIAGGFFVKNLISKTMVGAIVVGVCLLGFAVLIFGMKFLKVKKTIQKVVLSLCLMMLVFVISLFSGNYYSDDFCLYLAVIGLCGLYLKPEITVIQIILGNIFLILQYLIHPEKADPLGQFIMCIVCFTVAAVTIFMTIRRGRAYISLGELRAQEAEQLIESMKAAGGELKNSYSKSSERISDLQKANDRLKSSAREITRGSMNITKEAREVGAVCDDVHERMKIVESSMDVLNNGVKVVEGAFQDNKNNMQNMSVQVESVKNEIKMVENVFRMLESQIEEINRVTEQLNMIADDTNMLALNASIEAARAGNTGAGFAVVASKVQELAVDSNKCSDEVIKVVRNMQERILMAEKQLSGSTVAIDDSLHAMADLEGSFGSLTNKFKDLYANIETQNGNFDQMDRIFTELKQKIGGMSQYSEENQQSVENMSEAMNIYQNNMGQVVTDTKQIQELSASMLNIAYENKHNNEE